jgi:hypothetical protein
MSESDDNEDKGHVVTIIVNARKYEFHGKEISFDQVVKLAYPTPPPGANIVYTITYRKADGKKTEGSLSEGQSVKIKDGTTFNVTATDKS